MWVPLAVGALGVLGTLSAAIFAQVWSARREDRRWAREREAEKERWDREREERREQWRREDLARWLEERRNLYADLLLRIETWSSALSSAEGELLRDGQLADGTVAKLEELQQGHRRANQQLVMIAPSEIVKFAESCSSTYNIWLFQLKSRQLKLVENNIAFHKQRKSYDECLREAIRRDLRVDG